MTNFLSEAPIEEMLAGPAATDHDLSTLQDDINTLASTYGSNSRFREAVLPIESKNNSTVGRIAVDSAIIFVHQTSASRSLYTPGECTIVQVNDGLQTMQEFIEVAFTPDGRQYPILVDEDSQRVESLDDAALTAHTIISLLRLDIAEEDDPILDMLFAQLGSIFKEPDLTNDIEEQLLLDESGNVRIKPLEVVPYVGNFTTVPNIINSFITAIGAPEITQYVFNSSNHLYVEQSRVHSPVNPTEDTLQSAIRYERRNPSFASFDFGTGNLSIILTNDGEHVLGVLKEGEEALIPRAMSRRLLGALRKQVEYAAEEYAAEGIADIESFSRTISGLDEKGDDITNDGSNDR